MCAERFWVQAESPRVRQGRHFIGPQRTSTKVPASIRLSRDVVGFYKAGGPGWQARIDDASRQAVRGASKAPKKAGTKR